MFFAVKFGAGETEFFNADCMVWQIVESICNRCKQAAAGKLALTDSECHKIISLSKISESRENGRGVFKERGVYILLSVTKDQKQIEDTYVPLLEEEFLDPTFKIKLEAINTPHRRSTSFSTMRKKKKYTRTSTTHF